jgi:hypothetical protein
VGRLRAISDFSAYQSLLGTTFSRKFSAVGMHLKSMTKAWKLFRIAIERRVGLLRLSSDDGRGLMTASKTPSFKAEKMLDINPRRA